MLTVFRSILQTWNLYKFKKGFRRLNQHNSVVVKNVFDIKKVTIGNFTYGELNVLMWSNPNQKLTIGSFCSIAKNVVFILGGNHRTDFVTSFPIETFILNKPNYKNEELTKGPITIKDDVWIGYGSTILSGITVGQGAVIATNTTVTKDVPPYAIVGGNPAKIIRFRFNDDQIAKLLKLDYSKFNQSFVVKHLSLFQENGSISELLKYSDL